MSQQAANIYLLTGNDPAQIRLEADKLMLELAGPSPDPFSCDILQEGENGPEPELLLRLLRSISSPSLLGGRKMVWLKHYSGFADDTEGKGKKTENDLLKELAKRIQNGLPGDILLLLDGPGCDLRKALPKACEAKGEVRVYNRPDLGKKTGRAEMALILQRAASAKEVVLSREAEDFLLDALGGDTSLIDGELEKLVCYCGGPGQTIPLQAVEQLCFNRAEEQTWALADCLGKRSLEEALEVSDSMVGNSKDADRTARTLIMNAANFFRQALRVLVFMSDHRLTRPNQVSVFLSSHPEISKTAPKGSVETMHPFRAMMLAEQARRYTPGQMIRAIRILRDALWQTTSSAIQPHVALENALLRILGTNDKRC